MKNEEVKDEIKVGSSRSESIYFTTCPYCEEETETTDVDQGELFECPDCRKYFIVGDC